DQRCNERIDRHDAHANAEEDDKEPEDRRKGAHDLNQNSSHPTYGRETRLACREKRNTKNAADCEGTQCQRDGPWQTAQDEENIVRCHRSCTARRNRFVRSSCGLRMTSFDAPFSMMRPSAMI